MARKVDIGTNTTSATIRRGASGVNKIEIHCADSNANMDYALVGTDYSMVLYDNTARKNVWVQQHMGNLVSATDMGVYFKAPAASGQVFQLSFNDRNANSTLYGKVLTLTLTETGMFLWNSTDSVRVW